MDGIEQLDKAGLLGAPQLHRRTALQRVQRGPDRDVILAQYFEKGFPNATFEWSSKPAAKPNRRSALRRHEGQAQFVRQVVTTGLKITRPGIVNRILTLNPGDPLSPTAITDIQRRPVRSGRVRAVDAAIQDPDGEHLQQVRAL